VTLTAPAPTPPPRGLRRVARRVVPIGFAMSAITAGLLTMPALGIGTPKFVHRYATNPAGAGLVSAGAPMSPVPPGDVVTSVRIPSLAVLAEALPVGVLRHSAATATWTLERPVVAAAGAEFRLRGPGTLLLAPGAYVEVGPGGRAFLTNLTITAAASRTERGFLVASGGRLTLVHDDVVGLGRLASLTEGVSFEGASAGSGVVDSVVRGNVTGIFVTASSGVRIAGDLITGSAIDGVDLHGNVSDVRVSGNTIDRSGLHDVVLAGDVRRSSVTGNRLGAAAEHGVLLYNGPAHNLIADDVIAGTLDGVVVNQASANVIRDDTVQSVLRFGVRITGRSFGNVVTHDLFRHCAIGVYLLDHARGTSVIENSFAANQENVRIRRSAPGNTVRPVPPASELWSS
jgi:hypothetical protein